MPGLHTCLRIITAQANIIGLGWWSERELRCAESESRYDQVLMFSNQARLLWGGERPEESSGTWKFYGSTSLALASGSVQAT